MRRLLHIAVAVAALAAVVLGVVPTGRPERANAQLPVPTPTPDLGTVTDPVEDTVDDLLGDDPDLEISDEEIVNGGDDATGSTGGSSGSTGGGGDRKRDGDGKAGTDPASSETAEEERFAGPTPSGGFFVGGGPAPTGDYDTDRLVRIASRLKQRGMPNRKVMERVFAPFIIGGRAAWTNTWGAPRFGPAPGQVRQHQGQDVFCDFGAPVLATERGRVSFGDGGIGGKVARVHTRDGGYWYYAHLSGWNDDELSIGDRVEPGDLLGWCGNTGNAARTSPHVHFGHYVANGSPANPMRPLVKWLHKAERRNDHRDVGSRGPTEPSDAITEMPRPLAPEWLESGG